MEAKGGFDGIMMAFWRCFGGGWNGLLVLRCSGAFMVALVSPFGAADGGCIGWRSRLGVEDMASWCCCLVARFGWRLRER